MRMLLSNLRFTASVLAAVVVTAVFAFLLDAALEIVLSMLFLGLVTAVAEYVIASRDRPLS
ncbi:hypothetical protein [Bradyrhizobium tropiciagri]|uniref:hypothetical protein n=1 Tax=Bradyrhizobium tropiciagri TaxID=312253 RepID=UPI000AE6B757|nr:hypothetical protein [Bradyrhizobium tropiciagri]